MDELKIIRGQIAERKKYGNGSPKGMWFELSAIDTLLSKLSQAEGENERMARALGEIEKLSETNINDFKKIRIIRLLIDIGDRARKAREGPRG